MKEIRKVERLKKETKFLLDHIIVLRCVAAYVCASPY